jgi:hypothetical protein
MITVTTDSNVTKVLMTLNFCYELITSMLIRLKQVSLKSSHIHFNFAMCKTCNWIIR